MPTTETHSIPSLQAILEAAERIAAFVHRTPILTNRSINELTGADIFFKCENFQRVGAFKARGAMNAVLSLTPEERSRGVATHSSGNHGQAIALAARDNGIEAYIVMPENVTAVKKNAVLGYGAEVVFCQPTLEARESTVAEVVARTGAVLIHPFNDYRVIAGQATAAKELLEEVKDLAVVMAPVGGGGLISGVALCVHYLSPESIIIAGEPAGADDAWRSMQAGVIQPTPHIKTIADGLMATIGDKTFPIIQQYVKEVITVTDEQIVEAMRLVWERMKIIIEPSSAVPLAALIKDKEKFQGKRVGIILTGGNVDLSKLPF